ncbi:uncharacterized protein LOC135401108 isoform X2 [Ornithodoros turicata]|uniref:uncharacterized protein LOC135401108 isoform X2 n=1 Tax=Ornithodoros turicata TaxID=34597 RepID=UPI0031393C48
MPKEVKFQGLPGGPVEIEFSDEIPHWNTCSKCHMISLTMYVDPKNHVFCSTCVDQRSSQQTIFCQYEKKDIQFREMDEAYAVITALKNMAVYCPNKKQGCTKVSTLTNLQVHFLSCERTRLACGFCGKKFPGSMYEDHTNSCLEKQVQCSYCYKPQRRGSLQEHKKVCGKQAEICPKCNRSVLRMKFAIHDYQCTGNVDVEKQVDAGATDKVSSAVVVHEDDIVTAVPEPPAEACNPSCVSENDTYHEETEKKLGEEEAVAMKCEVSSTSKKVDAEVQTSHFQMSGEDFVQGALQRKIMMNVRKLPQSAQEHFNTLLELYLRALATPVNQAFTESFLGFQFVPLSKQNRNATQKIDEAEPSQEEERALATPLNQAFTEGCLDSQSALFSKPNRNETQKIDEAEPSQEEEEELRNQHDLKDDTYVSPAGPSSLWEVLSDTHLSSYDVIHSENAGYSGIPVPEMVKQSPTLSHAQEIIDKSSADINCSRDDSEHHHEVEQSHTDEMVSPDSSATDSFCYTSSIERVASNVLHGECLLMDDLDQCPQRLQHNNVAPSAAECTEYPSSKDGSWYAHNVQHSPSQHNPTYDENSGDADVESIEIIPSQRSGDDYHVKEEAQHSSWLDDKKACTPKETGDGEDLLFSSASSVKWSKQQPNLDGNSGSANTQSTQGRIRTELYGDYHQVQGAPPSNRFDDVKACAPEEALGGGKDFLSASTCKTELGELPRQDYDNKTLLHGMPAASPRPMLPQASEQPSHLGTWGSTCKEEAEHKATEHNQTYDENSGNVDAESTEVIQSQLSGDHHHVKPAPFGCWLHNKRAFTPRDKRERKDLLPSSTCSVKYNSRTNVDGTPVMPAGHSAPQSSKPSYPSRYLSSYMTASTHKEETDDKTSAAAPKETGEGKEILPPSACRVKQYNSRTNADGTPVMPAGHSAPQFFRPSFLSKYRSTWASTQKKETDDKATSEAACPHERI